QLDTEHNSGLAVTIYLEHRAAAGYKTWKNSLNQTGKMFADKIVMSGYEEPPHASSSRKERELCFRFETPMSDLYTENMLI
ncbi:hypothetical protein HID58_077158, partial [Brassica napus]